MKNQLEGSTALVTGATSGIGRAVATALAGAGAKVIVTGRRQQLLAELAGELGDRAIPIAADLGERGSIDSMFDRAGRLDILVNCAGVAPKAPILSGEFDDFVEMLHVNVLALAYCAQQAVKRFGDGGGHIVNVSSMSGHRVPPSGGFYSPTKFAVRAITESLRHELKSANDPTRVACISPGWVDTPLLDRYFKGSEEQLESLKAGMRMLDPGDVAASVLHIVTAPAHVEIGDILLRPSDQAS